MTSSGKELELWRCGLARTPAEGVWRGAPDLEERNAPPSREFSEDAERSPAHELHRRELFRLLGASAALAGLSGCPDRPDRRIVPYGEEPQEYAPGETISYATSMVLDGFATGLLAQSQAGRPIKIEGNPDHPASLGATGVHHQASILELYDPNRARALLRHGRPKRWHDLVTQVPETLGARPWFVLYPQSSPSLEAQIGQLRSRVPDARICYHTPLDRNAVYAGARAAFGSPFETQYEFRAADRVLALDADFASAMPMSTRWARDFAGRRRTASPNEDPGRLYVVEPAPTPTGSLADHRLALPAGDVVSIAAAVLVELLAEGAGDVPGRVAEAAAQLASAPHRDWARAVARDLSRSPGASIVIPGARQPRATHVLCHALNAVLGNLGRTVSLAHCALLESDGGQSLEQLAQELRADAVDTVVIFEANPVYTAPADLELGALLPRARQSMHLSLFHNETSQACQWLVPAAHYLETWGDARAYDGTLSLLQPLIRPLWGGKSVSELFAVLAGSRQLDDHLRVEELARARGMSDDQWRRALQRGLVPNTAAPAVQATVRWDDVARVLENAIGSRTRSGLELCFESDHAVYDGRFADNGWLQELPRPLTKLTWDNAALLSPRTAIELSVETEQVIELALDGRLLRAPALVVPGHADGSISLALGYGRRGQEQLAHGVGANAYRLRTSGRPVFARGLHVTRTGQHHALALSQIHARLHGREIVLHADLDEYRKDPNFTQEHRGPQPTWLPEVADASSGNQWAMSIDTTICSGCSACVVACQAENNIPVVGKLGVKKGRDMHWIRIDRYYAGPADDPTVLHQPMLCQHCENAPCEYVCPVFATTHSPDGLNEMVYNRCIGTRFCSNNCPYKVRRFNWFEYGGKKSSLSLQRNPNVSVRARGVMEKCSYCVQRIRRSGIQARLDNREVRPGEVQTACQQVCPTGAIQFGSLSHSDTDMVRWRNEARRYDVLHELGTRPRTVYLARIRNPNPELP